MGKITTGVLNFLAVPFQGLIEDLHENQLRLIIEVASSLNNVSLFIHTNIQSFKPKIAENYNFI